MYPSTGIPPELTGAVQETCSLDQELFERLSLYRAEGEEGAPQRESERECPAQCSCAWRPPRSERPVDPCGKNHSTFYVGDFLKRSGAPKRMAESRKEAEPQKAKPRSRSCGGVEAGLRKAEGGGFQPQGGGNLVF